jgi:hypothetical protein
VTAENVFEGINLFSDNRKSFLEYGSGRSTIQAAEKGLVSFSVETDWGYFLEVIEKLEPYLLARQVWIFYCDIGPVKAWGYPSSDVANPKFLRYSLFPWVQAGRMEINPELILIDGRFRVGSFLTSYQRAIPGTIILFNDYYSRPEYHIVERIEPPFSQFGDLAVFCVTESGKRELNDEKFISIIEYLLDPR